MVLNWTTASELNNAGFDVEFAPDVAGDFSKVGFVSGSGTANESIDYKYVHTPAGYRGQTIYYRLKQLDFDGTFEYSDVVAVHLSDATATRSPSCLPPIRLIQPQPSRFTLPTESKSTALGI